MKHLVSLAIALTLITSAYYYQFGLPSYAPFTHLSSVFASAEHSASDEKKASKAKRSSSGNGSGNRRRKRGATYVTVADVVIQPYVDRFSAIGTGLAQKSVSLVAEVSGQIREVRYTGTQSVLEGDVLIQLEDESERINVEIAQANLDKAEDSLERYLTLRERNENVVSAVIIKEEEAAVAVAKGNLALAKVSLKERAIRSPLDGKLGLSDWNAGDFLSNGATIADINNIDAILVTFELPERVIDILELNKKVQVTAPAKPGQVFEGTITAFDSVIDAQTRTITVKAAIENPEGKLWPGMTLIAGLTERSEPLVAIPAMALTWSRESTRVWVVKDGLVEPRKVTFRKRWNDTIWVESDLDEGMQVVVDGVQKLRPGASVSIKGRVEFATHPSNEIAAFGEGAAL